MRDQLAQYLIPCGRFGAAQRRAGYGSYTDSMRTLDHEAETLQQSRESFGRLIRNWMP